MIDRPRTSKKKWTEHSLKIHALKISSWWDHNYTQGLDGMDFTSLSIYWRVKQFLSLIKLSFVSIFWLFKIFGFDIYSIFFSINVFESVLLDMRVFRPFLQSSWVENVGWGRGRDWGNRDVLSFCLIFWFTIKKSKFLSAECIFNFRRKREPNFQVN